MQGFQGYGYNDNFVCNMSKVIKEIKENGEKNILLINYCDDICQACNNNENGSCLDYDNIRRMDNLVLEKLELGNKQLISPLQMFELVNNKLKTLEAFNEICGDCSWKEKCLFYIALK
jgi:hypothetical protein